MNLYEAIERFINDNSYIPMKKKDLFFMMDEEGSADVHAFDQALEQLAADAKIFISKKGKILPAEKAGIMKGTFLASAKGFGFVRFDEGEGRDDLYISLKNAMGAIHGDRVSCVVLGGGGRARPEGRVTHILERALSSVTGTLIEIRGYGRGRTRYAVQPDQKKLSFLVYVDNASGAGAQVGDKVQARITSYPDAIHDGVGHITHVFGSALSTDANYQAILYEHGIKTRFDRKALAEADELAGRPVQVQGRRDLRSQLIFTIDGEDAKDLDDAVSIEKTEQGYILGVHIADVSHYVTESSPLDREAYERGTSVYFADQVIPMLPKALSNGVCSLNAGEDKYALSAFIRLSEQGRILGVELEKSVICSKLRGVYAELNDVIACGEKSSFYGKYSCLFPDALPHMLALYQTLKAQAAERGYLELETAEAKIIVDEHKNPVKIVKRKRAQAEEMIEFFMLCANEAVASWLNEADMPCVYRIHEEPDQEKLRALKTFISNIGLDTRPLHANKLTAKCLQEVLNEAKDKQLALPISEVMLRSMMKARYSEICAPHFGLALDKYCHFTSPIRRYPDLVVHRIVKKAIGGGLRGHAYSAMKSFAGRAAAASSENEKRAMMAEREIEELYKCVYMKERIGQSYAGRVSSVTHFGLFVELENTCEGLVPITDMDGYYAFNENTMTLTGKDNAYTLADPVTVKIEDVDIVSRRVYMSIVD